jgi:hypothetical protein
LIVISDGDDNQSRVGRDVATAEALKSGVVMFTLSTFALRFQVSSTASRGNRIMENWAKVTGGQFFAGLTRRDAPKVFAKVLELIDGMYYARYVPPSSTNTIHEIDVNSSPKGKFEISYPRKYLWLPNTPGH